MVGKSIKRQKLQASDWLAQLVDAVTLQPAPDGWHTAQEVAQRMGRSPLFAMRVLRAQGAEEKRFAAVDGQGRTVAKLHFKMPTK